MQFAELIKELKGINFDTVRNGSDACFEAVFLNNESANLIAVLEKFFGPSAYPSKDALAGEITEIVNEYGGIMSGQTLYFLKQEDGIALAMLWPWRDARHTTLKIIKK